MWFSLPYHYLTSPSTCPHPCAGGEDELSAPFQGQHLRRAAPSNAYMLVYVRISDWDRVFCPVTKEDLNVHLMRRLEVSTGVQHVPAFDYVWSHSVMCACSGWPLCHETPECTRNALDRVEMAMKMAIWPALHTLVAIPIGCLPGLLALNARGYVCLACLVCTQCP